MTRLFYFVLLCGTIHNERRGKNNESTKNDFVSYL